MATLCGGHKLTYTIGNLSTREPLSSSLILWPITLSSPGVDYCYRANYLRVDRQLVLFKMTFVHYTAYSELSNKNNYLLLDMQLEGIVFFVHVKTVSQTL